MTRVVHLVLTVLTVVALVVACSSTPVTPDPRRTPASALSPKATAGSAAACLRAEFRIVPTDTAVTAEILDATGSIIEGRIADSGLVGADVTTDGTDRIAVTFPAAWDADDLFDLVTSIGRLDFVPIPADTQVEAGDTLPDGLEPLFSGDQLVELQPGTDDFGEAVIGFTLTPSATRVFADWTEANVGSQFAIVLDGTILAAPVVQSAITGGIGIITLPDPFDMDIGRMLTILRYGALPLAIEEVEVEPAACT